MKVKLSYATAVLLGFKKGKINFDMPTAYLMLGEKCIYNCSFCAQAKDANSDKDLLSRVKWPEYNIDEFITKIKDKNPFKRLCLQVVNSNNYFEDLKEFLYKTKDIPVLKAVSLRPKNMEEVNEIFKYNIDDLGISIDVANKELFGRIRGGSFDSLFNILIESSKKYPGKITTHVIVGLGETDEDLINLMFEMKKYNILVSLFAFTPVAGTEFEKKDPPSLERYRKIQLAREIIEKFDVKKDDFEFKNGILVKLPDVDISYNEAIKTSGCSFCTRPYYNEKPNKTLYNVPHNRKY
ncbi:radical SAM protein [Marinitoga sp. 38H-ov]|uniref:radical SAM protein n=1 Tax=Marinitoga sp. 38H-ov TaxID=1755814 RepID=UPI0013EC6DBF|nr:radical SAM protein [Marinitoga sp. 38H-ov]KAF2956033.1 radical SAM protein [Marinitoga sp. 38H-ov]